MASLRDFLPVGDFGRPGLPGMFSLADADSIRTVLTGAGFTGIAVDRTQAYGAWGHGAEDAADFLLDSGPGRHLLAGADASARAAPAAPWRTICATM
ncbi:hypothetical protein ACI2L4_31650 [Streptomyces sparsogenes]|uniref:hypothetical protein n=1 Tax=Streptomyces sparsogenes TaxID=67365 RepID=UPI0038503FF3